ncbi:MAG: FHA domain-containing protein [Chthoniobacter sp.]|nr:FHA domain-containing protein [Chthoniobacter sp.]
MTTPSSLAHPLEAIISCDGHTVARCVLRRGRYRIGHDRSNDITIDEQSVSAKHAVLTVEDDGEFFIEDLGSTVGTRVNDQPAFGPTAITLECQIQIGGATIEFQRAGLPASVFQFLATGFLGTQRYAVGEIIVQGSTSTIYDARDLSLGRAVAMKIMLPESQAKPGYVLRFIREAQIAAQLQHPGILPIYDLGLDEQQRLYSTTRFVEGDSLAGLLDTVAAPTADAPRPSLAALLTVFQKVCDAVAYAHSHGVVHCTLRPEIITVGHYGEVFVNNWGLAKLLVFDDEPTSRVQAPEASAEPALSRYTSPEQAEGALEDIDTRTDIHALGGLLFRILTLRDPITGETDSELLEQALSPRDAPATALANQPPCPHWPGEKLPEYLAAVAMKALSLNRDDRHPTVRTMQQEIAAWQEGAAAGGGDAGKLWKGFTGLLGRHKD